MAPKVYDMEAEIARANAPTVRPTATQSGTMKRVVPRPAEPELSEEELSEEELFAIWQSYLQ